MRSPTFTAALVIALAVVTVWWQLSEKRARKADAELAQARARVEALVDSLTAAAVDRDSVARHEAGGAPRR